MRTVTVSSEQYDPTTHMENLGEINFSISNHPHKYWNHVNIFNCFVHLNVVNQFSSEHTEECYPMTHIYKEDLKVSFIFLQACLHPLTQLLGLY